jgi:hypothetical protein
MVTKERLKRFTLAPDLRAARKNWVTRRGEKRVWRSLCRKVMGWVKGVQEVSRRQSLSPGRPFRGPKAPRQETPPAVIEERIVLQQRVPAVKGGWRVCDVDGPFGCHWCRRRLVTGQVLQPAFHNLCQDTFELRPRVNWSGVRYHLVQGRPALVVGVKKAPHHARRNRLRRARVRDDAYGEGLWSLGVWGIAGLALRLVLRRGSFTRLLISKKAITKAVRKAVKRATRYRPDQGGSL